MSDNELLLAIADIVGKNTKALEKRIDRVEESLGNKIDEVDARLSNKIDEVDARLSNKIDGVEVRVKNVENRVKNIELRLENIIEPRLSNIENCYISTYEKYRDGAEKIDMLQMNIEVMQSVVREYGVKLNALTA